MKEASDLPEDRRVYVGEVELTEVESGASRRIPLESFQVIRISRKKDEVAAPPVDVLRFKDGDFTLEARSFEEFREQLRARYPDERYERRLHVQRDREAEERRERALEGLMQIIVHAAVDECLKESDR